MKIRAKAALRVVGKPEPGEYNGQPTYKLFVMCADGNGELKCTEDVYKGIGPVDDRIVPIVAELLFNDAYKTMTVTAFQFANAAANPVATASPTDTTSAKASTGK